MPKKEDEKQIILSFLSFLEGHGYLIATLLPEKGLQTVAQSEKLKLVEEFLEEPE